MLCLWLRLPCASALAGEFKSSGNENAALYEKTLEESATLRAFDAELGRTWQEFYNLFDGKAQITVLRWSRAVWAASLKEAALAHGNDPAKYATWQRRHNPFPLYMKKVLQLARAPDGRLAFALYPVWQIHESPWERWMTPYEDAEEAVSTLRLEERGQGKARPGRDQRGQEWKLLPDGAFYYSTLHHDAFDFTYYMRPDASGALNGSVHEALRDEGMEGFMTLQNGRISFSGDPVFTE